MAMKVRRIVTGHNASGKAIVKTDEQVTAFKPALSKSRLLRPLASLVDPLWVGKSTSSKIPSGFPRYRSSPF